MHSPFLFTIVAKDLSDPLFKAKNAKSDRIGEVSGEMVVATIGNYILWSDAMLFSQGVWARVIRLLTIGLFELNGSGGC